MSKFVTAKGELYTGNGKFFYVKDWKFTKITPTGIEGKMTLDGNLKVPAGTRFAANLRCEAIDPIRTNDFDAIYVVNGTFVENKLEGTMTFVSADYEKIDQSEFCQHVFGVPCQCGEAMIAPSPVLEVKPDGKTP